MIEWLIISSGLAGSAFIAYHFSSIDKKKKSTQLTTSEKLLSPATEASIDAAAEQMKASAYAKELMEAAVNYDKQMDKFFDMISDSYVNPAFLEYLRFKQVDIAHKYALNMQEDIYLQAEKKGEKVNHLYLMIHPTRSQILESYDYAIKHSVYDLKTHWREYHSMLHLFKMVTLQENVEKTVNFQNPSREDFKNEYTSKFPWATFQGLLFLYDNQKIFLQFYKSFKETDSLESLLLSLTREVRFDLMDAILATSENLGNSAARLTQSLSTQLADDFITSMKLAKQEEE